MRNILRNITVVALLSGTLLFSQAQDTATAQRASAAQQEVDWLDAPTPDGSPTLRETSDWLAKTLTLYGGSNGFEDGVTGSMWSAKVTRSIKGALLIADARIDEQCHFIYNEIYAEGTVKDGSKHQNVSYTGITVSVPLGVPALSIENTYVRGDGHKLEIQTGSTQDIAITTAELNPKDFWMYGNNNIKVLRQAAWPSGKTNYTNAAQLYVELNPPSSNEPGSQVTDSVDNMRPRIISALQHAAALCRSTYQAPAQKKEPF